MSQERQCHFSQVHSKKGELSLPVLPRGSSDCTVCPSPSPPSAFLPHRNTAMPASLHTCHSVNFSNSSLWALLVVKTCESQPLSLSQSVALGKRFPCAIACVFLSLLLSLPPPLTRATCLPQHPPSISPPNPVTLSPTFRDVASSLSLVVQFILSVLKSISLVFRMI